MRHIIYLDYDGTIQPENVFWHPRRGAYLSPEYAGHRLFEHSNLLEALLEPFPGVRIVLSTSWVKTYGFTGAAKRLTPGLQSRCIGSTFHSRMDRTEFDSMPRGQQVIEDVWRRKPTAWVALDDDSDGWPPSATENLVLTHPVDGIAHPPVLALLTRRLEQQFGSAREGCRS